MNTNTRYIELSINTLDSAEPAGWMNLADSICPGAQSGGKCRFTAKVRPDRLASLEAALNADDDVIDYEIMSSDSRQMNTSIGESKRVKQLRAEMATAEQRLRDAGDVAGQDFSGDMVRTKAHYEQRIAEQQQIDETNRRIGRIVE